ncbi:MAG: hypothetical protein A3H28_03065 [Acidobacteria bacterium RIFCSPLOWO2_02_FULL_61_28]|nr:MAG: hypothetical protein A3H28_03065 [Acidobacteria bacterium RIFCSPLOWO2_02_FULL_61_28]
MTIRKTLYGDVEVGDGEDVSIEMHGPHCRIATTHFAFGGTEHPIPRVRVVIEHVKILPPSTQHHKVNRTDGNHQMKSAQRRTGSSITCTQTTGERR